ncbi:MAG: hypothetical protein AB1782_11630 [Cyanobacteriota bacterium]
MEIKGYVKQTIVSKLEEFNIIFFKNTNELLLSIDSSDSSNRISVYTVPLMFILDGKGHNSYVKAKECNYIYKNVAHINFEVISSTFVEISNCCISIKNLEYCILEVKQNASCVIESISDSSILLFDKAKLKFSNAERSKFKTVSNLINFGFEVI